MFEKRDIYTMVMNNCFEREVSFLAADRYAKKAKQFLADNPEEAFNMESIVIGYADKAWLMYLESQVRVCSKKNMTSECIVLPLGDKISI